MAVTVLSLAFLIFFASRVRKRLTFRGKQASAKSANSLTPTWAAPVLTIGLSLPMVLILWGLGGVFSGVGQREAMVLAIAGALYFFRRCALWPLELLRQVLRPGGLADCALWRARKHDCAPTREGLRVLIDLGLPILMLWSVSRSLGARR